MELAKSFDPKVIEAHWYSIWESSGYFKPSNKEGAAAYCIMLPPPNVTGTLHMGHAFQHTLMDALIRYHRMMGDNTLWQPGTDHRAPLERSQRARSGGALDPAPRIAL